MHDPEASILIRITPTFQRKLRALSRKFRRIREDLQPLIDRLEAGELSGDRIPGIPYECYKVRLPNSSAARGKSGGFRVVYLIRIAQDVVLVTIYSKSDLEDVSIQDIQQDFEEFLQLERNRTQDEPQDVSDACSGEAERSSRDEA